MNKFWMVWRVDGPPARYQHDSAESASAEAERLARENPACAFVVLEAVERFWVEPVPVRRAALLTADQEVPF